MKIRTENGGFSLPALAQVMHGLLVGDADEVTGFAIDSRKVRQGDLFVALKGENTDGHKYVGAAFGAGAACALLSKAPLAYPGPYILVDDTAAALGRLARAYKNEIAPFTVAVTGSVGKTTTKQMIASILSQAMPTLRTEGNFNNELGLPLTLLSLTPEHKGAVLEMGMSMVGEIEYLSTIASPDVGVVTCIGTSHIENLGSREAIRDAKLEIVKGMNENGVLILNGDEPLLRGRNAIYVGYAPQGKHTWTILPGEETDKGSRFSIVSENGSSVNDLFVPVLGKHNVADAALACVAGLVSGCTPEQCRAGLASFENTGLRQRFSEHKGLTLIADCYNASPESMEAALNVLASQKKEGRRILAVLGEMRELGSFSPALHERVGIYAAKIGVDLLFTFGEMGKKIADGALAGGIAAKDVWVNPDPDNPELTASQILSQAKEGDVILFKASRALALERVISIIKEN